LLSQIEGELSQNEGELSQIEGLLSQNEGELSQIEGLLSQNEGELSQNEGELPQMQDCVAVALIEHDIFCGMSAISTTNYHKLRVD